MKDIELKCLAIFHSYLSMRKRWLTLYILKYVLYIL